MKMAWKCLALIVISLMLSAAVLALPAAANGDDRGKGWHGDKWDKDWGKWDRDRDRGWFYGDGRGGFPVIAGGYPYPVAYPVGYPVYVPANFGYDQGACYQACVNSGQYSPEMCGRMCYYA